MKRVIQTLTAMIVLVFAIISFVNAAEYAETSHEKTADATIFTGRCQITAVHVITNGTDDATLIIYDGTAAGSATNKVCEIKHEGTALTQQAHWTWPFPVSCLTGIYADIEGTGASYIIEYLP